MSVNFNKKYSCDLNFIAVFFAFFMATIYMEPVQEKNERVHWHEKREMI